MYEQDIELARLVMEKLQELDQRHRLLEAELQQARDELDETERVRDERSQYMEVLARAAQLLERQDLQVSSPDTGSQRARVAELEQQAEALAAENAQYRDLVEELRARAPRLIAAVEPDQEFPTELSGDTEQPMAEEESPAGPVESETSPEEAWHTESAPPDTELDPSLTASPVDNPAPEEPSSSLTSRPVDLQQLFSLKNLKLKEAFTFGKNAAYVVDASSVLDRVPHYDLRFRAAREIEVRDALIHDLDQLSRELSGDFFVIFNSWHDPQLQYGNRVVVRHVMGAGEGTKSAVNDHVRDLVADLATQQRVVCVVTGDTGLADSVRANNVHVLPLSEFFNT